MENNPGDNNDEYITNRDDWKQLIMTTRKLEIVIQYFHVKCEQVTKCFECYFEANLVEDLKRKVSSSSQHLKIKLKRISLDLNRKVSSSNQHLIKLKKVGSGSEKEKFQAATNT